MKERVVLVHGVAKVEEQGGDGEMDGEERKWVGQSSMVGTRMRREGKGMSW